MKKIYRYLKYLLSFRSQVKSFTIIGVGPGDPSLLTIAAIEAIKKSKVIFYPISGEDKISYSAEIVKNFTKSKKKIPIVFPMGRKGFKASKIWESAAEKIIENINKNKSVALLCLGDPSIYASCSYIADAIKKFKPEIKINIIPGISSLSLASALSNFQLINQGETLEIFECPNESSKLSNLIKEQKNKKRVFAIMKIGKRWKWVKNILTEEKIIEKALLVVNVGMENQFIGAPSKNQLENLPYFSLLLIRI